MTDWSNVPIFGRRADLAVSVVRPSVYGLVEDQGRLALARTSQGTFLPGGGIDEGEAVEEALQREIAEECGLIVRLGEWSVCAIQLAYSPKQRTHFEKRSAFIECAIVQEHGLGITEVDHELVWVNPQTACELLSHESHRWAVQEWNRRESRH